MITRHVLKEQKHTLSVLVRMSLGGSAKMAAFASLQVRRSMNAAEVQTLIQTGLPGAQVRVESDDDTHFEAVIVAPQFEGRRMIQRHQLVYATLGQLMGREIHALSMQAFAPSEQHS